MAVETQIESPQSPLETFVLDYVATVGGEWDEVEPQVYDLLLPEPAAQSLDTRDLGLTRVTFDPEALPEHPRAQLASLGTPLVDGLLHDAIERARFVELHFAGLNLQSRHWVSSLGRAYTVDGAPSLTPVSARMLDFPQMVFGFEVTFVSDQREQEILPVAIDLHYGRQTRHLDLLIDAERLAASPPMVFPTASLVARNVAYRSAREQVVRTVTALANTRNRELRERLDKQVERMNRYYDDLRQELEEQAARSSRADADPAKFRSRQEALIRERDLRAAELRKKSTLSVRMKLLNVLVVHQPKLIVQTRAAENAKQHADQSATTLEVVWDPLTEAWEAAACPQCQRPTFELFRTIGGLTCVACRDAAHLARSRRTR